MRTVSLQCKQTGRQAGRQASEFPWAVRPWHWVRVLILSMKLSTRNRMACRLRMKSLPNRLRWWFKKGETLLCAHLKVTLCQYYQCARSVSLVFMEHICSQKLLEHVYLHKGRYFIYTSNAKITKNKKTITQTKFTTHEVHRLLW